MPNWRSSLAPSSEQGEYRYEIRSPEFDEYAGQPFRVPLSAWEIEAARDAASSTPAVQRSWMTQTADFTKDVGARLFDSLFAGRAGGLYQRVVNAHGPRTELRLRLATSDRLVMSLPWELLYDHEIRNDFIVLSTGSLAREVLSERKSLPRAIPAAPLKVLLVTADTPNVPEHAGVEQEIELFRQLADFGQLALWILKGGADLDELRYALAQQPHVIHYAGTGVERRPGEQALLLPGTYSSGDPVSSDDLVRLLSSLSNLRLVFLNGCNTDWIAAAIADIPAAALGMRGLISSQARSRFAAEFYRSALGGAPLDVAASHARRQINVRYPGSREWAVPILYLQGDGTLLQAPRADTGPMVAAALRDDTEQLLAAPRDEVRLAAVGSLDVAGNVVAVDPERQGELEYLNKKLAVTRANLEALQLQKEHLGEAMPPLMASQITELEEQLSETSRRISELER